jgi:hypothetical protein
MVSRRRIALMAAGAVGNRIECGMADGTVRIGGVRKIMVVAAGIYQPTARCMTTLAVDVLRHAAVAVGAAFTRCGNFMMLISG